MVKTAAAAFAFLALFGTPIAAQFADAEEAKSWFFLQRIARDVEDLFHCASIVAAADSDRGLEPAAPYFATASHSSHKTGDKPVVRAN
jgi:hypothetical protein